jgi:hypothetical protein
VTLVLGQLRFILGRVLMDIFLIAGGSSEVGVWRHHTNMWNLDSLMYFNISRLSRAIEPSDRDAR